MQPATPAVADLTGIQTRLLEVPLPAGNYSDLSNDGKRLYFMSRDVSSTTRPSLKTLAIDNKSPKPETFAEEVSSYELTLDRKKLMVRKAQDIFIFEVGAKAPTDTSKNKVALNEWSFRLDPRDEWRQMFTEGWRLERDYFYDRNMHGVDWAAMKAKYLPLVDRVTDRAELSDILAQMVGELSALHIFVRGGDARRGADQVQPASLGAMFVRDEKAGGFRVTHIYKTDSDVRPIFRRWRESASTCRRVTSFRWSTVFLHCRLATRRVVAQRGGQAGLTAGRAKSGRGTTRSLSSRQSA